MIAYRERDHLNWDGGDTIPARQKGGDTVE